MDLVLDGKSLTIDKVAATARSGGKFTYSEDTKKRISACEFGFNSIVWVDGKHDHLDVRPAILDQARCIYAIYDGHLYVHDDNLWLNRFCGCDRFLTVGCLAHNIDFRME